MDYDQQPLRYDNAEAPPAYDYHFSGDGLNADASIEGAHTSITIIYANHEPVTREDATLTNL
jgi:hypothetical protein